MLAQAVTATAVYEVIPINQYAINVQTDGNGTASASASAAAQGTQITLTTIANTGYRFKQWQVISGGITIANNKFTMPANAVTIKALFEVDSPQVVAPTIIGDKNVTLDYRGEKQLKDSVTGEGLTWSSSNTKYVDVDPATGRITSPKSFVKTGSATITAQNSAGKVEFNVKVKPIFLQWLMIIVLFGWIWM